VHFLQFFEWMVSKLNCFDQKTLDTVLTALRELVAVQREGIDWNLLDCVRFLTRFDSSLLADLYLTVFSRLIRATAAAAAFSKCRRGLEMPRLEDLHLMTKHQSFHTIVKELSSVGKKIAGRF
jgi:hypothetical protein